ncbi:unnamed protein product, partial [Pocillopora meandrina]
SAIYWNKTPPANVKGILGENVTLGWNFTISSAETLDNFVLLRSSDDMIRYDHSKGEVTIFENFKGRVAMSVDGSPKFVLFNLQGKDDKAKFCLKVYTKIKSTGHAQSYWPTPKCAKIELLERPGIVDIPKNHTVTFIEGKNVTINCSATGIPTPNVTWTKSGNETKNFPPSSPLKLENVSREEDGLYWCVAENGLGKVTASVRVIVQYAPSISIGPISQTVNESDDLELFCNATGRPTPQITWYRVTDPSVQLPNGTALKVKNINRTDSGVYQCRASNGIGTDVCASANVTVNFPPSLDYTSDDTTVNETDNVTLFCNATGYPHPRITWTFLRGSESTIVGREESLPLSNVSRTQAGTYQCMASNDWTSSKAANVQVTVNYKPFATRLTSNATRNTAISGLPVTFFYKPEIKDTVQSTIYTWINRETKLTCAVDGVPRPNITFTRAGSILHSTPSENGASQLIIKPEGATDFGDYTCTAKNHLGSVKKIIKIKQIVAPAAPEGLEIETGLHTMEIHWQSLESTPDSPVEDYLVIVEMKGESESRKTCIRVHTGKRHLTCAINDLESGTVYSVKVAARNKVGYSEFAEKEVQTESEAKPITNTVKKEFQEQHQQEHLSNTVIDGIIAGVLIFCSLVVVIFAVLKHRRPCHPVCKKESQDLSSEECNEGHDNPVCSSENPVADEMEERVNVHKLRGFTCARYGPKPMNTSFISCSADNTVWVNDGIVFSCSSISSPSPATYVIYHNGKKIKKNRSGYHKICNVKRQHAGNYTCQPRNTFGNGESKSIRLTVYEKLAVHAIPRWRNVTEGRAARFECSAAGSPPLNITWTSLSTGKVYSGGLLLIKSVQRNDTGDYQCSASNGLSAPTKDIVFLNVLYPPTITDTAGPNVNVKEGYKLTLYCHGNGNPQPVFTWKLLGTNQTFSGGDERNIMLHAQKSHAGVYLCTASNFLGNVSKTITVNVWSSPVRPILTHLECGSSFIRVSWKVLSQEEGSFVISYVAQAIDQDNPRNVFNCSDITINHCIIKGLQPNTTYLVRVYSTNVAGHGVSEYERITTKGEGTKKQQGTDNKTNEGLSTTTLMTVLAAVGIAIFVVLIGTLIAVRRTRSVGKG